MSDKSASDRR